VHLLALYEWLADLASTQPAILSQKELAAAITTSSSTSRAPDGSNTPQQLAELAPALLRVAGKAAVLLVVSVLAGLLMPDAEVDALLKDPGRMHAGTS
jgi:hypothetical protein